MPLLPGWTQVSSCYIFKKMILDSESIVSLHCYVHLNLLSVLVFYFILLSFMETVFHERKETLNWGLSPLLKERALMYLINGFVVFLKSDILIWMPFVLHET